MKLPQISRSFPAALYIIVVKTVVLAVVAAFLALNLFWRLPAEFTRSQQAKLAVMFSPNDVSNHLLLTQAYLEQGNMPAVERELTLASNFTKDAISVRSPNFTNSTQILGASLSPLKILEKIKNEPQRIKNEISFWEKVVAAKPNYRDGYLQLALLHYQIYEINRAKENLQKAKEIDPNFEATKELEKMFKPGFPPARE